MSLKLRASHLQKYADRLKRWRIPGSPVAAASPMNAAEPSPTKRAGKKGGNRVHDSSTGALTAFLPCSSSSCTVIMLCYCFAAPSTCLVQLLCQRFSGFGSPLSTRELRAAEVASSGPVALAAHAGTPPGTPQSPIKETKIDMSGWLPVTSIPERPAPERKKPNVANMAVSADALGGEAERLQKFDGARPLNDTQARLALERAKKPPDFTFKTYVKPAPVFMDQPTHIPADKARVAVPDEPVGPQHGPLFSPEAEAERCVT
jgi:hypothetical protein